MDDGKVLITGAGGFLGNLLATHLAPRHGTNLILLDHAALPATPVSGARYVRPILPPSTSQFCMIVDCVEELCHSVE